MPERICVICREVLTGRMRRYCSTPCHKRGEAEGWRVSEARAQSRRYTLADTLTLDQWLERLHYFAWKCAYCKERPAWCIDHFTHVCHGGGTTADNCVPCCKACSDAKGYHHPDKWPFIPREPIPGEDIERVRSYLSTFAVI